MAKGGDGIGFPSVAFDPNWQERGYPTLEPAPFICPHPVVVKYATRMGAFRGGREWGREACALCGSESV